LWDQYRQTPHWTTTLKPATRRQRENLMRHVLAASGQEPFASINRKSIIAGRDASAATPSRARHFLDVMRRLFRWALEAGYIKVDPTAGVQNLPKKKGGGFKPWDENDVEAYQRRWSLGTRQRVWLDVLLYTGLRRADAALIGAPARQKRRCNNPPREGQRNSHGNTARSDCLTEDTGRWSDWRPCLDLR
jgi:site-specific recombinase XerD